MLLLCGTAAADTVTVGLFAPSAPFPSTAARVELASKLGEHLGKAAGATGVGHVYARASDFAAAVKKGDVSVALVDASYLAAAGGNFTIIATTGDVAWQLVAKGSGLKIAGLKGKRVLVPTNGGRETDFVLNVMLGGEVAKDFFAKIEPAPDTASALAALGLGKADAAVVPVGVELPPGVAPVLQLPTLPGPVLVVYASAADKRAVLGTAANSFHGDATIAALHAGDAEAVRGLGRRFAAPVKRGPFAVPAVRLLVGDLVEGRTFQIERAPVTPFATR